ncbi:endoglucanase-like isoform X2 [Diabrotica virgifera virgifera]|uniref:Cellulase n=1 Tax=Diabrotica virgifera virgifera TaxID=50390 RepID=A0A4D6Q3Q5_DIAVI|nr:endoglucanase-like isoform X2 [Diabrotica virgifera virgifera]QCF40869.1 glycoside hydrolase family 45 protein [Diabrotica virgifera virgifera]
MIPLPILLVLAVATSIKAEVSPDIIAVPNGLSGKGITTRYWDCCKPSCAWADNVNTPDKQPLKSCRVDGEAVAPPNDPSGCDINGSSFVCNNNQPYVVNSTLSYGFASASFSGGIDTSMCCSCMLLNFEGQLKGKQFLVQLTNSGEEYQTNQFDLGIPGGGVGLFPKGCTAQWNAPSTGWGDLYGGVHTEEECNELPEVLQPGCKWRFTFMEGVSNPEVTFYQVQCPRELVERSGCVL